MVYTKLARLISIGFVSRFALLSSAVVIHSFSLSSYNTQRQIAMVTLGRLNPSSYGLLNGQGIDKYFTTFASFSLIL